MSSGWMIVIASFGSSALTGMVAFGLSWLQNRREAAAARWQSRRRAYSRLLSSTAIVVHTADTFHHTMQSRSGIGEGVDVLLHVRRPLDPLDLHELLRPDITALHEALAEVWTVGTRDAVRLGTDVVGMCGEVMKAATERGQGRSALAARLGGEKWTADQLESWQAAVHSLASARADFAKLARKELGIVIADPFLRQGQGE